MQSLQDDDSKTNDNEKYGAPVHLETVLSKDDAEIEEMKHPSGVDAETAKYLNSGIVIDEAANKRVLKLVSRSSSCSRRSWFERSADSPLVPFRFPFQLNRRVLPIMV